MGDLTDVDYSEVVAGRTAVDTVGALGVTLTVLGSVLAAGADGMTIVLARDQIRSFVRGVGRSLRREKVGPGVEAKLTAHVSQGGRVRRLEVRISSNVSEDESELNDVVRAVTDWLSAD